MYLENIYMYLHVCTNIYYVNKNFNFGCDYSFDSTNIYQIRPIQN